jgi:heat shock 70kDa protein 1/2/6/8
MPKCNSFYQLLYLQLADKEEFEHKQKELEKVCMPIMTKLYQGAGGVPGGFPGAEGRAHGAGSGGSKGPTIEEVD